MGDLGVKYTFESQDQIINNIRGILNMLKCKNYDYEIENLYEDFIHDIQKNKACVIRLSICGAWVHSPPRFR